MITVLFGMKTLRHMCTNNSEVPAAFVFNPKDGRIKFIRNIVTSIPDTRHHIPELCNLRYVKPQQLSERGKITKQRSIKSK
jgi:hypothetical protein